MKDSIKRIVVAGALGHIGSRIAPDLARAYPDTQIVLLDSMLTQRYCSLFNLPTGHFEFVEGDITTLDLDSLIKGSHAVLQFAAITDAAGSVKNREIVEKNNLQSTKRIAEACLKHGTRLLHLSSTSVYGTAEKTVAEDCDESELKPQSPYAETKLNEEKLLQQMASEGLKFVTLRFGTICGTSPGMRFHTAINRFCWQASMGQAITVWRTALNQKRPYLALTDASRAVQFCLEKDLFSGEIYNVLTANLTVQDIIDHIKKFVAEPAIEYVDSPIMNQLSYEVIWEKFQKTGFKAEASIAGEIDATMRILAGASNGRVKLPGAGA
ncbi:MAG: SDR family oxidoreductase [Spirochaetia bacterium]|nr:SDR family oxidoreductase [Spirochaetia bacterium]